MKFDMFILSKLPAVILIYLVFYISASSQGCSDAGFCTINSIKGYSLPFMEEDIRKNSVKAGISYGVGEYDIKIINPYLEYKNIVTEKLSLSGKITYALTDGELGNYSNPGDLFLSSSYLVKDSGNTKISFVSGIKIPLDDANISSNGESLPMNYQSSLGTFDLIFGVNISYKNLAVNFAIQEPIININENKFIAPEDPDLPGSKYQTTINYNRKGDILNRISYTLNIIEDKFLIRPGILSIYHLTEDLYTNPGDEKNYIVGSRGLTLNGNVFLTYNISNRNSIEMIFGTPFITRESRPDGLTREFVGAVEYKFSF